MRMKVMIALLLSLALCLAAFAISEGGDKYDLSAYGYRYVKTNGRGSLIFQKSPRGSFMKSHKFHDGDRIYVNLYWRQDGYAMAYENGDYGYVDASYIDWGSGPSGNPGQNPGQNPAPNPAPGYPDQRSSGWQLNYIGDCYVVNCNEWVSLREHADASSRRLAKVPLGARVSNCYNTSFDFYMCEYNGQVGFIKKQYLSANPPQYPSQPQQNPQPNPQNPPSSQRGDAYDLSQYDYRRVSSNGRGSLIFQKSPRGSFMKSHKFYDGDWIYVNVNWRQDGYAMAYENGEYGYVDASYIAW